MAIPSQASSSAARRDFALAVVATSITCLLLCLPGDSISPLEEELPWVLPPHADKLVHGVLFFLETWFLHRSLRWWPGFRPVLLAVVSALTLALSTELLQGFIPRRNTDGMDLLADGLGILAFVIVHLLRRRRHRYAGRHGAI